QLGAERAQQGVVQSLEDAVSDVAEDVQEVHGIARDQLGTVVAIELFELIDFVPELGGRDVEMLEERFLHVLWNEGLIEVPDDGDSILGEEGMTALHHRLVCLVIVARLLAIVAQSVPWFKHRAPPPSPLPIFDGEGEQRGRRERRPYMSERVAVGES